MGSAPTDSRPRSTTRKAAVTDPPPTTCTCAAAATHRRGAQLYCLDLRRHEARGHQGLKDHVVHTGVWAEALLLHHLKRLQAAGTRSHCKVGCGCRLSSAAPAMRRQPDEHQHWEPVHAHGCSPAAPTHLQAAPPLSAALIGGDENRMCDRVWAAPAGQHRLKGFCRLGPHAGCGRGEGGGDGRWDGGDTDQEGTLGGTDSTRQSQAL